MANTPVFTDTDLNSASDMQVRDMLFERGLHIPLTEDNKLIRKHAIRLLMDWRQDHASMNENARKCRVIFHTSSNPSAGPYVYASVNSKNFQAPYGKEVIVPEYMLRELRLIRRSRMNSVGSLLLKFTFLRIPIRFLVMLRNRLMERKKWFPLLNKLVRWKLTLLTFSW